MIVCQDSIIQYSISWNGIVQHSIVLRHTGSKQYKLLREGEQHQEEVEPVPDPVPVGQAILGDKEVAAVNEELEPLYCIIMYNIISQYVMLYNIISNHDVLHEQLNNDSNPILMTTTNNNNNNKHNIDKDDRARRCRSRRRQDRRPIIFSASPSSPTWPSMRSPWRTYVCM